MAGYIGSKTSVTVVSPETDSRYVNVTGDTMTGNLVVPMAVTQSALSNRNKIINGNFDVWQRGTSGSAGSFFVADRWKNYGVGSTHAVSQQTFTVGQTDVPDEPQFFHRSVVTSSAGASNFAATQQRIDGVRTFAGKTVTLSFWAKADASKNIAVEFSQDFGVGGSSAVLGIGVQTCSLTTDWQKFTVTASLPSIAGKTVNAANVVDVTFWLDAGSDYNSRTNSLGQQSGTFDLAQVQLEVGDTATPFEHRSYGQELALCQRYYSKVKAREMWGAFESTTGIVLYRQNPVPMRASPTTTRLSTVLCGTAVGARTDNGSWAFIGSAANGITIAFTANTAAPFAQPVVMDGDDAIAVDAEL